MSPEDLNNRAWRLAEKVSRTPAENEEMLKAARAAAQQWEKDGDEIERARGAILLGQVYALLGDGKQALHHARAAFAYVTENEDSPPWQVAFAHAVMANAAAAHGDGSLHKTHYQHAKALGSALIDDDERALFEATFHTVPVPA